MSKLLYNGQPIEWSEWRHGRGWFLIEVRRGTGGGPIVCEANVDGTWSAYRPRDDFRVDQIDGGAATDLEAAKAAAEKCLLDNGIVTCVNQLPATGAYTFHFRADKGGATVVATVVRGPDTTVLYGVSFCSPRDSFDKNLGRRLAAFRLIDKPSTLVLPGLVGPREIKAAILAALVIPPGNRLVR